jgi:DNA-binding winged helix-turn-helix (wHTH) protein
MTDRKATIFLFSPFRLDPARRLLTRDGRPIALKPKEFDTLLVLVEEDGRVVDKDDLMARVWPDCYVSDGSLAKNISILRKALGEGLIETHRGRGYRITLPVIGTFSTPQSQPEQTPEAPQPQSARNSPETVDASSATNEKPRWWIRAAVLASVAAVFFFAFAAYRFIAITTVKAHLSSGAMPSVQSIFIEKSGGLDPIAEGFGLVRPDGDYPHVMRNSDNTGFDRWRLVTDDQNFYYRKLSDAEKEFALQHDWKLTCVCALEKGSGFSDVDLGPGIGPRFDIGFDQEGGKYFVDLTKQISPQYAFDQRVEFKGVGDVDHPHTYELRYDHTTQAASLWIDGQERASGYRGHHQYQENYGLMFGAITYRNAKLASMVFREVRFEVN